MEQYMPTGEFAFDEETEKYDKNFINSLEDNGDYGYMLGKIQNIIQRKNCKKFEISLLQILNSQCRD